VLLWCVRMFLLKCVFSPCVFAQATEEHVAEAMRLFHVSTLNAAASGIGEAAMSGELMKEVRKAEDLIKRKMPVGTVKDTREVKNVALKQVSDTLARFLWDVRAFVCVCVTLAGFLVQCGPTRPARHVVSSRVAVLE
jgi:hypothetical protein